MSMQSPAHPDPERLAALAGNDREALADGGLSAHVADCAACGAQVHELIALRVALAELPDLVPSRPLRLIPPVPEPAAAGGWRIGIRRAFAPVAVAGMVLLLVGAVGATGALGPADADALFRLAAPAPPVSQNLDGQPYESSTEAVGPAAPETMASPTDDLRTYVGAFDGLGSPKESGRVGAAAQSSAPRATDATSETVTGGDEGAVDPLAGMESRGGWIAAALAGLGLLALALVLRRVAVPADRVRSR